MDAYAPDEELRGPTAEQRTPYSEEAEQAVLGSILINGQVLYDLKNWFQPYFFHLAKHQWIYEAMLSLVNRGEEVDNITVIEELRQRNQLESVNQGQVSALPYMTYLINSVDRFFHVGTYARIVKECWKRRQLLSLAIRLCNTSVTFSPDGQESAEAKRLLEEAASLMADPYDPETDGLRQYLIHAKDLANLPSITWLVPGEIPERGLTVVYGPSGVGKSFFVLDYALRVAQYHDVLYVAAEGESGFKARVAAWEKHNMLGCGNLRFYLNVAALLDEKERRDFTNQIVDFVKPKLIILDTVAHCILPGDENSTRDMGLFLRSAKEIQKQYDCAVLLVHHTNKEGIVERGSGALRGASDSMIKLIGDDDIITVECSKSKDTQPFQTRYIKLLPIDLGTVDTNGNPEYAPVVIAAEKVVRTKDDPLTNRQRLVLETINEVFGLDGAILADLVETTKIPRGSLIRTLAEMKKIGLVSQNEKGAPYILTADGCAALGLLDMNRPDVNQESQDSSEPTKNQLPVIQVQPAEDEADPDDESMNHKNHDLSEESDDESVILPIHVSLDSKKKKAVFPDAPICPMCEIELFAYGNGMKCPDCGLVYHEKKRRAQ